MPLHFFFCDMQSFLPILALQYHEVEIRIKFASSSEGHPVGLKFYASYALLDTDERAVMVNSDHELLVEQVQKIPVSSGNRFDLGLLNHPVKCLLWGSSSALTVTDVQLYLNGTEIFGTPMPTVFFRQVQSYFHTEFGNNALVSDVTSPLYMHSFALKAGKHQPCGTCNFSRLDTAILSMTVSTGTLSYLYAVNFNVLRIKKGMAGLAFSN